MHSGCENEPIDLEGLHESVVDSDEDLADSMDVSFINEQTKEPRLRLLSFQSLAIRDDKIREALEKDPVDREDPDLEILLEFTQRLEAFKHFTMGVRRALCAVMVFAVVEKAGTVVMNDNEELDSWSVIINGEVQIDHAGSPETTLTFGHSFGITPTMEKVSLLLSEIAVKLHRQHQLTMNSFPAVP